MSRAISVQIDIVNRFVSVQLCALNFVLLLWLRVYCFVRITMSSSLLHSVKTQKTINDLAAQWRLAKKKVVIGSGTTFCNIAADEKDMQEVDFMKIPDGLIK